MQDERTLYLEKLAAQMVEWEVQIEHLQEQAENATAEEKFELTKTIAALQLKRDQGAETLRGIAVAHTDDWEDMKAGAEQIWAEIKNLRK